MSTHPTGIEQEQEQPGPLFGVPLCRVAGGALRVGQTRVSLDSVLYAHKQGATPEAIVRSFPSLDVHDARAVIDYYRSNREYVDAYLRRRREEAEALRAEVERQSPQEGIRERLLARQAAKSEP